MLVLSRRSQESVVIGGRDGFERVMKITVLDIRANHVSLGFEVDADIPVYRSEVLEKIRAEITIDTPVALSRRRLAKKVHSDTIGTPSAGTDGS